MTLDEYLICVAYTVTLDEYKISVLPYMDVERQRYRILLSYRNQQPYMECERVADNQWLDRMIVRREISMETSGMACSKGINRTAAEYLGVFQV